MYFLKKKKKKLSWLVIYNYNNIIDPNKKDKLHAEDKKITHTIKDKWVK
jgi:hypothetical protein